MQFCGIFFDYHVTFLRNIIRGRMRWAGNVTRMGEKMNAYRILRGSHKERDNKEDLDVGGTVILKLILEK
jgi:hypothetical protein